jgi:hypothetical protein
VCGPGLTDFHDPRHGYLSTNSTSILHSTEREEECVIAAIANVKVAIAGRGGVCLHMAWTHKCFDSPAGLGWPPVTRFDLAHRSPQPSPSLCMCVPGVRPFVWRLTGAAVVKLVIRNHKLLPPTPVSHHTPTQIQSPFIYLTHSTIEAPTATYNEGRWRRLLLLENDSGGFPARTVLYAVLRLF